MKKLPFIATLTFTLLLSGVALAHDTGHQETTMTGPDVTDEGVMTA